MVAACKTCSAKLRAGARFCWRCGEAISQPAGATGLASRGPASRQPATRSAGVSAAAHSSPATTPEEAIIGDIAPVGMLAEKAAQPAHARKETSIIAAGSVLRPASAAIFSPDRDEPRTRPEEPPQDPLPWLKFEERPPAVDAKREVTQEQVDEPPPAEPQPATQDDRWPVHPAVAAEAAPGLAARSGARVFRLDWKAAAVVVLAGLGAWYWYARSAAPTDSAVEASAQGPGASLATVAPAGTDAAAVGPTPLAAGPTTTADGQGQGSGTQNSSSAAPEPPSAAVDRPNSSDPRGAEKTTAQAQRTARAASRKRAAKTAPAAVAPPPPEEVAVVQVAPPQPAPEPPPPAVAPGPCDGLAGLKQQQCLACGKLGPLRKFDCELRVKDAYCQGKWGSSPSCTRDLAVDQAGGG